MIVEPEKQSNVYLLFFNQTLLSGMRSILITIKKNGNHYSPDFLYYNPDDRILLIISLLDIFEKQLSC